jgi:Flp pilus assembly protein TadG
MRALGDVPMVKDNSLLQAGRRMDAPAKRRRFGRDERGYALTLTLVALPLIMGVAAFVIDASRVANLHTDLQDAADAMALAGARQLDGRDDAITRAKLAIQAMNGNGETGAAATGNTAWFGGGGDDLSMGSKVAMTYNAANGQGQVVVTFMEGIPAQDDLAINDNCVNDKNEPASCDVEADFSGDIVEQSNRAAYVRVRATPVDVNTIFPVPGIGRDEVSVTAEAVATYEVSACDITPIFICNPFESPSLLADGRSFNEHFKNGDLYGRQVVLRFDESPGPGNFGFLRTGSNGASALGRALAYGTNQACYNYDNLTPEPGQNVGQVDGLNTRFGLYSKGSTYPANDPRTPPDINIRKGQAKETNGQNKGKFSCDSGYKPVSNTTTYEAMPFPEGTSMTSLPGAGSVSTSSNWDIATYWDINHGGYTTPPSRTGYAPKTPVPSDIPRSANAPTSGPPSRHDVYRYESSPNLVDDAAPNGETGQFMCTLPAPPAVAGRREIFAAVANCTEHQDLIRGTHEFPAETFVRVFLTRPANLSDRTIHMEIIDVSGEGGLGTVENFLREEAELVR